jgi:hypothetical protein
MAKLTKKQSIKTRSQKKVTKEEKCKTLSPPFTHPSLPGSHHKQWVLRSAIVPL